MKDQEQLHVQSVKDQKTEMRPWHTPKLHRAEITFDTTNTSGSGADGGSATTS